MAMFSTVDLTCDKCGFEDRLDLADNQTPAEAVDLEGWTTRTDDESVTQFLCYECYVSEGTGEAA
jgi:hypothetical protein